MYEYITEPPGFGWLHPPAVQSRSLLLTHASLWQRLINIPTQGVDNTSKSSCTPALWCPLPPPPPAAWYRQRDVEAEPGAFGTLVVQLPCAGGHTGGRLVVRHKGASFWHNSEKVCLGVGWWWGLRIHDQQTMSSGGCGGSAGSCTSISAYQLEHTGSSTLDQPRSTEP